MKHNIKAEDPELNPMLFLHLFNIVLDLVKKNKLSSVYTA